MVRLVNGLHFCLSGFVPRNFIAYLRGALFSVDVSRHGEPGLEDFLRIVNGRLQQLFEVLVFGHVLVAQVAPLRDRLKAHNVKHTLSRRPTTQTSPKVPRAISYLSVENQDLEESVHEKNTVRLDTTGV